MIHRLRVLVQPLGDTEDTVLCEAVRVSFADLAMPAVLQAWSMKVSERKLRSAAESGSGGGGGRPRVPWGSEALLRASEQRSGSKGAVRLLRDSGSDHAFGSVCAGDCHDKDVSEDVRIVRPLRRADGGHLAHGKGLIVRERLKVKGKSRHLLGAV